MKKLNLTNSSTRKKKRNTIKFNYLLNDDSDINVDIFNDTKKDKFDYNILKKLNESDLHKKKLPLKKFEDKNESFVHDYNNNMKNDIFVLSDKTKNIINSIYKKTNTNNDINTNVSNTFLYLNVNKL